MLRFIIPAALNPNVYVCTGWHSRMHMGRPVMEDAVATPYRQVEFMIMHHAHTSGKSLLTREEGHVGGS